MPADRFPSLDIPPLVENGNAVGVTVAVESPMTKHVRRIALINQKNPQANVAVFHLGPRAGRARVSTRIRLATSQTVVALAERAPPAMTSAGASGWAGVSSPKPTRRVIRSTASNGRRSGRCEGACAAA